MKTQKGNITVFTIIIIVIAITAGVIGWMFGKQSPGTSLQEIFSKDQVNKNLQPPAFPE